MPIVKYPGSRTVVSGQACVLDLKRLGTLVFSETCQKHWHAVAERRVVAQRLPDAVHMRPAGGGCSERSSQGGGRGCGRKGSGQWAWARWRWVSRCRRGRSARVREG